MEQRRQEDVVEQNQPAGSDETATTARTLNLPAAGFDGLLAWVLEMRSDLGIPHSFRAAVTGQLEVIVGAT